MAVPTLTPTSTTSAVALTSTGSVTTAADATNYAFGIYVNDNSPLYDKNFVSGAVDQVSYTYKKLGGDVLDVELTVGNVYTAYEEAVLEYSYIVNIHQAKNSLSDLLGNTTGSFDHDGMLSSSVYGGVSDQEVSLKFPRYEFSYARRAAKGMSEAADLNGTRIEYSASFDGVAGKQIYDLQKIASSSATSSTSPFFGKVGSKRILIRKVFYRTPHVMWRFYGYYGGLNSVGNLSTYGMFADDSTFEVIPPWQNKMQAMAYEDSIYTRNSHYSYELHNNVLKIFPAPTTGSPEKFWFTFTLQTDAWDENYSLEGSATGSIGTKGVNNMNTLPYANIPFKSINSIGKQWIRRFALALTKEMLGQIRGKFATIPIPGENVNLNSGELLSQAKDEQEKLREELKTVLDELTYAKLAAIDVEKAKNTAEVLQSVPCGVYVG